MIKSTPQMALEAIRKAGVSLSIKQAEQIRKIIAQNEVIGTYDISQVPFESENLMVEFQKRIDSFFTDISENYLDTICGLPILAREIQTKGRSGDMVYYIDKEKNKIYQSFPDTGILRETSLENTLHASNAIRDFANWVRSFQ